MPKTNNCPSLCQPVERQRYYRKWLVTAHPPNSYAIDIAYTNTTLPPPPKKSSIDDSYGEDSLNWMTMPPRFTNYAQAKVYGSKYYPGVLFRVSTSSMKPNHFKYDSYGAGGHSLSP